MKRNFLVDLGLEETVIDKIMSEHGKTVQRLNDKVDATKAELQTLQSENEENKQTIEEFKKVDVEGLKKEASDWKAKYESFERDSITKEFFNSYKFTSDLAKKASIEEFKLQNFKLKDGKFEGAEEYMKKFIENNKEAFIQEKESDQSNNTSTAYNYSPNGSNGEGDPFIAGLDDIFGKN